MKKSLIHFVIITLLILSLFYSISSTASNILISSGRDLHNQGNIDLAEKRLKLAAKTNPLDVKPLFYLGILKHKTGTHTKNIKLVNEAKKEDKKKTPTAGEKLQHITTRVPEDLIVEMKIYCAKNKMRMQDFITAAIQTKLKLKK